MRTPPGLLAGALLLWGWQCHTLSYAVPMGAALEAARLVTWRWRLGDTDFNRVADFSGLIFLVVAVYQFSTHSAQGIYTILEWLPFIFFLLLVTQLYSERGHVPLSALFISLRRHRSAAAAARRGADLSYPYLLASLIAASAGERSPWFFAALCVAVAWALWPHRPKRFSRYSWCGLLLIGLGCGYLGQLALHSFQLSVEGVVADWMDQMMWRDRNPGRVTTAIGSIGRLKLSDRIRLRVRPGHRLQHPMLLREAAYNTFSLGTWSAIGPGFESLDPLPGTNTWVLGPRPAVVRHMTITAYLRRDTGVVPLPLDPWRIKGPGIIGVSKNGFGAVTLETHPGYVRYQVSYGPPLAHDGPLLPADSTIPAGYRAAFGKVALQLRLRELPPLTVVSTLQRFFQAHFRYSLVQRHRFSGGLPLSEFLLHRRSGHCEYFASATVLLLREAGIPARYAVGYSVQEYSPLEGQYIVRARNAHAWALAYIGGRWEPVDTTPAVWSALENARAPDWQPLYDLWAWATYRLARWRLAAAGEEGGSHLLWLLPPLVGLLAWRLASRQRIARSRPAQKTAHRGPSGPGLDSEMLDLVGHLEDAGTPLRPGETLQVWALRAQVRWARPALAGRLHRLLALHYRYRFDPRGITADERTMLRREARACRERLD